MRLLERQTNGEFRLKKFMIGQKIPLYAILSHTWPADPSEEVNLTDIEAGGVRSRVGTGKRKAGTVKRKSGYDKLNFCADQAESDGLRYFWIDSCCIDQSNHAELSEAINSMFRWYRNSTRCYVYLSDVSDTDGDDQFIKSRWFTRGWTLQELLAPSSVEFFTREGKLLGDKTTLGRQIHQATQIATLALQGQPLSGFDVNERFKWAETRQTTREEDWAYCLLGIFGVFMPLIYGEGKENAIRRLKKEIQEIRDIQGTQGVQGAEVVEEMERIARVQAIRQNETQQSLSLASPLQGTRPPPLFGYERYIIGHTGWVVGLDFSLDGKLLATCSEDKTIRIWDSSSWSTLFVLKGHKKTVFVVAFSPDGKILASYSTDGTIRLWNMDSGDELKVLECSDNSCAHVVFSPDGKLLAAAVWNGFVLWYLDTGAFSATFTGQNGYVTSIAFSSDGNLLTFDGNFGSARLWDVHSGACLRELKVDILRDFSGRFSPDNRLLATASDNGAIGLWDFKLGVLMHTLQEEEQSNDFHQLSFSRDGKLLASTIYIPGGEITIRIWDMTSKKLLQKLRQPYVGYRRPALVISPNGKLLVSNHTDDTFKGGLLVRSTRGER